MAEIDLQMKEQNFMADHLFVTAANMTQAGCELGAKILNWPCLLDTSPSPRAKSQCVTLIKELHNDEDQSSGSSDDS